jgi:hypothetical protein
MSKYAVIVGRFEHVDILGHAKGVPAKIDTGAYRSAIHASDIEVVKKNGGKTLKFKILGHPAYKDFVWIETDAFNLRTIRNSTGHQTTRYEVTLKIRLGYKIFLAPFTLIDRSDNIFPVLIGRTALNKRFLVDTDKTGLSRTELKKAADQVPEDKEYVEGVPR